MLKEEKRYEFRDRLRKVNPTNVLYISAEPASDEFVLTAGMTVQIPDDAVIYTAAKDFADFMLTSMETPVCISKKAINGSNGIKVTVDESYKTYKAYKTEVSANGITITAHDARGAAQALFRLEDIMLTRHAPFVPFKKEERKPLYSPRMVHSGYGLDNFPTEHLMQIAKAGMDAIIVFAKGVDETPHGYLDFNELVARAALHGLDVYIYSYMRVFVHPDAPGAREQYENAYGKLFSSCPRIKGVVLVGESVGFPTKDPNAAPYPYDQNKIDGIPTGKPSADMWPCLDYADWLGMLKSVIYKYNPDADIVFWSYNWGGAPKEHRIALIENLPTDISLLVTYESFHKYKIDDSDAIGHIADYTISFEGPSEYFTSEAEAAMKRGIRLYAMANTGGNTWDFGTIPYVPTPYQWIKRYATMKDCHDKYGLCGVMESHHYGFWPSFVSETAKEAFEDGGEDAVTALRNSIIRHYGNENLEAVDKALALWSEAITYIIPSNEDQYGGFRTGPGYPFNLGKDSKCPPCWPAKGDFAMTKYPIDNVGHGSLSAQRINAELESLMKMLALFEEGQAILDAIENPNTALEFLINFGRYLICHTRSGIGAKRFYRCVRHLPIESDVELVDKLLAEAESILREEYANCEEAKQYVKLDSRLGWEPRMEYRCTTEQIDWKLKQLEYVINAELRAYRNSAHYKLGETHIVPSTFI